MADSDSLIFPSKKRKLEEENYEEPLLEPPLQENLLPESQLSGSQTVVTDIFDLTLVEQESEKLEDRFVWKKIELQSVTSMLQKLDRSPENTSCGETLTPHQSTTSNQSIFGVFGKITS
ncbi:unnamed protein product [Oikopleura dioica]|uniref:Uncharacterized protein n=1 Tax=Oikopleura dioica TaxID=34765 RepID=E4XJ78_OIKDI|nr:unnamed protein product [Oikopleura dioica]